MPKLLKKFSIVLGVFDSTLVDGSVVIDSDFYFELYRAYRKYYLIAINRTQYNPTVIKFTNPLNAVMLFKEIQNDALSRKLMIYETAPYWVLIRPHFSRKFWTKVKKSNRIIMNPESLAKVFDIGRVKDYLEYK
jgi:hypothetical protein